MSLLILLGSGGAGGGGQQHFAGLSIPWRTRFDINGTLRDSYVRAMTGVEFTFRLGSRSIMRCSVIDRDHIVDTENAYRPQIGDDVIASDRDTLAVIFRGKIFSVEDDSFETHRGVETRIECVGRQSDLMRRVIVNKSWAAGTTTRAVAQDLVTTYLAEYGITLNPAMGSGPVLETALSMDGIYVEDGFKRLSQISKWIYRVDESGVLDMFAIGTRPAPYNLDGNTIRGKIVWKKSRGKYANVVILRAGGSKQFPVSETFNGDGITRIFPLSYQPTEWVASYRNGGYVHTAPWTTDTLFEFNYDPPNRQMVQAATTYGVPHDPLEIGETLRVDYTAQGPFTVSVQDDDEIALRGRDETIVDEPDVTDKAVAQSLARTHLNRFIGEPRVCTVPVNGGFVQPGCTLTFTAPKRLITGQWLVTAARAFENEDGKLWWTLELLEGDTAQDSWVDFWRQLVGGNQANSSAGSGFATFNPVPPETVTARQSYFLGGSNIEYMAGAAGTWIPYAIRVKLDPAVRGSSVASVKVRLRAAAGAVTARLYNVTDSVAVGQSVSVNSPQWTDATFAAVLTAGSKDYELQIQPSVTDADVAAVGYLE